MIDLHSHTTASDGQHAPEELIALAAAAGVTTLAVTDHDTVGGLAAAAEAARAKGLTLIPGIELSAFLFRKEIHVLGHFLRPDDPELARFQTLLGEERRTRMEAMVRKMRELGFPVTMEQVLKLAGEGQLARPHLARVLVERGWCLDTKEAFDRFLGDGRAAFVDRFRLTAEDAIRLIRDAGGTATLAHPAVSRVEEFEIAQLRKAGLAGLEVEHSDQSPAIREKMLGIARRLDLVPTSGSDFHGEKVAPGRKLGSAAMNPVNFEALRARAAARAAAAD